MLNKALNPTQIYINGRKQDEKKKPTSICKSTHTNIFEQQNKAELQNTMCVIINHHHHHPN